MNPACVLLPLTVLSLGLLDRGIFSDLAPGVRISAPPWKIDDGARSVRVDDVHKVVTVYEGRAPLVAYPLTTPGEAGTVAQVLPLLSEADAGQLSRLVEKDLPVSKAVPTRRQDRDGDGIVDALDILMGAKKLCLNRAAYREEYRRLSYPGGDVPRTEGVCTDTLIRSLRNAGWDLQKEIHEALLRDPRGYPLEKKPDANIDHRRVRMLIPWFNRNFTRVDSAAPFRPGDIVLLDTFPNKSGPDHAGVLSDRLGPSGKPLVINNWTVGYEEQEMDLLPSIPVTHRYRTGL